MAYSTYEGLQILLFGAAALAFCLWQVRSLQRPRPQRVVVRPRLQRRRMHARQQDRY
jgi:hypothetical protein